MVVYLVWALQDLLKGVHGGAIGDGNIIMTLHDKFFTASIHEDTDETPNTTRSDDVTELIQDTSVRRRYLPAQE